MKKAWSVILLFALCSTLGWTRAVWAQSQTDEARFSQIKGKVQLTQTDGKSHRVYQGDLAHGGDTIQVGTKAQAQVTLFDGSTLDLSPNSKLTLKTLQHSSAMEKVISLQLALGKVLANVRKLLTAKSAFEIEAGGVVCGVRGTSFSVNFDPTKKKLDVNVYEGAVAIIGGGSTHTFTAGQAGHYLDNHFTGGSPADSNGNGSPSSKGAPSNPTSNNTGNTGGTTGGSNTTGNTGTTAPDNTGNTTGNTGNTAPDNTGGTTGNTGTNPSNTGGNNTGGSTGTGGSFSPAGLGNVGTGGTGGTGGGSLEPNTCLGDFNNQFITGVQVNSDNSLSSAQQTVKIHLVVP